MEPEFDRFTNLETHRPSTVGDVVPMLLRKGYFLSMLASENDSGLGGPGFAYGDVKLCDRGYVILCIDESGNLVPSENQNFHTFLFFYFISGIGTSQPLSFRLMKLDPINLKEI